MGGTTANNILQHFVVYHSISHHFATFRAETGAQRWPASQPANQPASRPCTCAGLLVGVLALVVPEAPLVVLDQVGRAALPERVLDPLRALQFAGVTNPTNCQNGWPRTAT